MAEPPTQWAGDEPYLALPNGYRITPYRPGDEDDIAACVDISNDPKVAAYSLQRPYPYVRSDAEFWFNLRATPAEELAALRAGSPLKSVPFQVIRHADGRMVGDVGLVWEPQEGGETASRWTIGYTVHPKYHGQGIGSSATAAVLAWAGQYWPGDVVHALIEPKNVESSGLARKLGFKQLGIRTEAWTRGPDREVADWERVL